MKIYPKVALDLYVIQMVWTFFYLGIMLIIHVFKLAGLPFFGDGEVDHFYVNSFVASNIYMLVIGIIAIVFLRYYVENGVTRRDYYKGTLLAAIGLSITIPIITIIISFIERLIVNALFHVTYRNPEISTALSEIEGGDIGDLIGEFVLTIVLTPYIDPADNWLLSLAIFSLNIFTYYILGWLISSAFHHSGVIAGLAVIAFALILLMIEDSLLRMALDLPVMNLFEPFADIPSSVGLFIVFFILILSAWIIRMFTRRVRIKM